MLCLYDREISLAQIGCNAQTTCKIEKTNMKMNRDKIMIALAEGEQHHIHPPPPSPRLCPPNAIAPTPPAPGGPVHATVNYL